LHKSLFVKSDYYDFNWLNSCLWFDVMFGYVNLVLIELLMMKLHAQDVYICILCVFTHNWWNIILLLMNSWICVGLEGFYEKWVKWWIVLKWCFDFKFYIVLSVFYVHKPINNLWEQIWMLGIKIWVFGWKIV